MKKYAKYIIILMCIITFLITMCFIPIRASRLIPIVEEQASKDLGVNVHLERLIIRMGPHIKVKAPIIHILYEDGQKFAQLDNVKFYIPWSSLFKKNISIKAFKAKKLSVRINSDDKYLSNLLDKLQEKEYSEHPDIYLKEYNFSYFNKPQNDKYILKGQFLELNKIRNYKNFKIKTKGNFSINSQQFITYDLNLVPKLEFPCLKNDINLIDYILKIKNLDFHSDIIADLQLYKNQDNLLQASGFINVDNISVLDIAKKNPKSFVYLTLWGDKASVLSNIYTSVNKKVYIEGMINNSKKTVLDLKVRTDEIELKDLYQKLRIITDFSQIKDIQELNGNINANFTLKGDLRKIKSNGFIKIENANIKANGLQIDNINSDIDLSNNVINIVKAVGYVNKSPIIAKGRIDKNVELELLMNKVDLKYLCPTSLGVKNGIISLIAHLSGSLDNITHKENLLIENLKINNKSIDLDIESIKYDTNKDNNAYVNNIICTTKETEVIKVPSLKFIISPDSIKLPETSLFMPNSKLVLKGDVLNYNNNPNYVLNINGFINSKDLKRFSTYSTRYPIKILLSGNKQLQNINAQTLFEKTDVLDEPTVINLISKIEKNSIKIEDLSLIAFNGKLSDDLKQNLKGLKKLTITGYIENLSKPLLKNIRIFIPQQLNLNIYDTIAQLKGDIFVNGEINTPEIIGQLSIQNLFNQAMQLTINNCTLDFNKNNLVLNAPLVKLADSSMGINALISTDISKELVIKTVNVKSKYLNTDTLLMYKDNPVMKIYPIKILDGKFYAERILANIYASSLYLSAFTSDLKMDNDIITLKNISSELFNGKFSGEILFNLKDENFSSNIMARAVSAEPIFNVISTRKDSISGVMDFDANITGGLTSKESLNGNIKFIVNNGRMSTLGKLEHLLYAQNVIADNMLRTSLSVVTKAITLKDTGLFKYLRGDVDIENGLANINLLQSQGPLMSLFIKGQYNPLNDYAKLVVLGRLSDEVISGLGAFGDFSLNKLMIMLTGEDNVNNIYPEDFDKIPQLMAKNTKEFRTIINGIIDKPSSVILFNWISYSKKSLKQKEVPMTNVNVPTFVEELPY